MDSNLGSTSINDVVDYVIGRFVDEPNSLSLLKLQKLAFYLQAWHIAFGRGPLFDGKFQAWVHGPVNRQIYDRFKDSHSLYASVGSADIRRGFDERVLGENQRKHIDEILEAYGGLSGNQLEAMTHDEQPWKAARGSLKPNERCETEIDEGLMGSFYSSLLTQQKTH